MGCQGSSFLRAENRGISKVRPQVTGWRQDGQRELPAVKGGAPGLSLMLLGPKPPLPLKVPSSPTWAAGVPFRKLTLRNGGGIPALPPGPPPLPMLVSSARWQCRGTALGMRLPAWCQAAHVGDLLLALLGPGPVQIEHPCLLDLTFGCEAVVCGLGAPSTLPVSPCGKPAAPTSASSAAAPLRFWRPGASGGGLGGDPPASSVPASYCPYHLGHGHTGGSRHGPASAHAFCLRCPAAQLNCLCPWAFTRVDGRGFFCLPFCKR